MSERRAERYFLRQKAAMVRCFGTDPMTDDVIDIYGRATFGKRWGGVGDQRAKIGPGKFYIINTSWSPKSPGVHWVAVSTTKSSIYGHDTFARDMNVLMRRLLRKNGVAAFTAQADRSDAEQVDGNLCGQMALAWLHTVKALGIRAALQV
jgi:hypothetical protein